MADFRRWLIALAVVGLFAGFSAPARAQGPAFNCSASVGVPPIIRHEGLTEQVGDITLTCTGGTPTPAGKAIPPVDISVFLNVPVTSKVTSVLTNNASGLTVKFVESLVIVDEPHSGFNPARNLLNCGNVGAPDSGNSGPGVCSIISDGNPADSYDGSQNTFGTGICNGEGAGSVPPPTNSYGCGRPNVFQGRAGNNFSVGAGSSVTFAGVPIDPPGSVGTRTVRITNIRVDAFYLPVPQVNSQNVSFALPPITAQVSISGNTSLGLSNQLQNVAYVENGLASISGPGGQGVSFLQCQPQTNGATNASITFTEGFLSAWKTKNISYITTNGHLPNTASYWTWNNGITFPPDVNQNVPGAIYNTESGFMYPTCGSITTGNCNGGGTSTTRDNDPSPNPPQGVGTAPVTSTANAFFNNGQNTGISQAGIATQGTRLAMALSGNPHFPANVKVAIPTTIPLINTAGNKSGVMVLLTNTDAAGAGGGPVSGAALNTAGAGNTPNNLTTNFNSSLIVYEIVFADPFSIESATVPFYVTFPVPTTSLAETGATAQVTGAGFAPFYSDSGSQTAQPTSAYPIPRFVQGPASNAINLFTINKCTCNILFPFVTSVSGFDTGIAIANTSQDPSALPNANLTGFSPGAGQQSGSVTLWFFGSNSAGQSALTNTQEPQCTGGCQVVNGAAIPGTGSAQVPAGQSLLFTLSSGGYIGSPGTSAGLDNRWAGYTGYLIAQTQFQYCHAYAFITSPGLSSGLSEGYLGLVLDNNGLNCDNHLQNTPNGYGLCRTSQQGESLAH